MWTINNISKQNQSEAVWHPAVLPSGSVSWCPEKRYDLVQKTNLCKKTLVGWKQSEKFERKSDAPLCLSKPSTQENIMFWMENVDTSKMLKAQAWINLARDTAAWRLLVS